MKATWLTSAMTGVIFGGAVSMLGSSKSEFVSITLMLLFFGSSIVGVIGIGQLREMHAERKKRGLGWFGVMAEAQDFTRFYIPGWGRMFLWFAGAAITSTIFKAIAT